MHATASPRARARRAWWLVAALATLAGCAPIAYSPAGAPPASAPPVAGRPAETAPPRPEPSPRSLAVDSLPSAEAERVLASIPDPIAGSTRPEAPRDTTRRRAVPAPEAAYDTLRAGATPEGGVNGVPVPAPTRALGSDPSPALAPAESLAANPPARPAVPPPAAAASGAPQAPPPASAPTSPPAAGASATSDGGPCWRVQVAAPAGRDEAESRRSASSSLLLVDMVIEPEKGLFKVRTRGCLGREAALALKQRALDSGFEGSFIVDTSAAARPAATPPRRSPRRTGSRR
jgi:hypothetical protein